MSTPVYQYNVQAVEQRLVKTLKRRNREATVADLVAETGLPTFQVEEQLKRIVNDYQGHLKVTESGEILYHFPGGMKNQVSGAIPRAKRFFRKVASVGGRVLKTAFKVWTMVMLVGYFVVFVLLIVLALLASMAAQAKGGSGGGGGGRGRMGGFGSFYLTTRLMQMSMYLWLYSGGRPDARGRKPKERPLHQSVFAFIFGDGDPAAEWDERERRAFIAYLRAAKGVSTVEDLMQLTGRSYNDSQQLLNRLALEFEGEPDVTESGTLIYRFDQVLRSSDRLEQSARGTEFHRELKPLIPFNTNKPGLNKWIGFFNGFNLLFGTYFTAFALSFPAVSEEGIGAFFLLVATLFAQITTNPVGLVFWVMGVIPLLFSAFFFLIPVTRRMRERRLNEQRARENVRKRVINAVLSNPEAVDPEMIDVSGTPGVDDARARALLLEAVRDYAAERGAEVEEKRAASGNAPPAYVYRFTEVAREQQDVDQLRSMRKLTDHDVGDVVFDSGAD